MPFLVFAPTRSIYSNLNSIYPITTEAWNAFRELLEPIDTQNGFRIREGEGRLSIVFAPGLVYSASKAAMRNFLEFIPPVTGTGMTLARDEKKISPEKLVALIIRQIEVYRYRSGN